MVQSSYGLSPLQLHHKNEKKKPEEKVKKKNMMMGSHTNEMWCLNMMLAMSVVWLSICIICGYVYIYSKLVSKF